MSETEAITRRYWTAMALTIGGGLICCVAAIVHFRSLGWWQAAIYLGAATAIAGAWWYRRLVTTEELAIETHRSSMRAEEARLGEERERLTEFRRNVQEELTDQSARVQERERGLADRLSAFHEWVEFPAPVDLSSRSDDRDPAEEAKQAEFVRKDRQLHKLLQDETQVLFDYIKANRYSVDGKFQIAILRDDLHQLAIKTARIYQPDLVQPLLETSLERILRAAGRACLQFLVMLDELPFGVKEYNLNSLYAYLRRAVNAYGAYKSAEPYWGYMNTAYYVGRIAMGTSPVTLGAWWFLGTLGKEAAKNVTTRLINRQALGLLQNAVRIVGYEMAMMYGGDFRHRDPNWIYGAELTDMLTHFPISRDGLRHALREIGTLQLRSEYDRIFLNRCIASSQSAQPGRYQAVALLNAAERRAIASRLEKFLEAHLHGKSLERVQSWRKEAETRLQVKISVGEGRGQMARETQWQGSLKSLVGFLLGVKQLDFEEVPAALETTQTVKELPKWRELLDEILTSGDVGFFENPDLDPDDVVALAYFNDLAMLAAVVPPHDASLDELLLDTASYLRIDRKEAVRLLESRVMQRFQQRFLAEGAARKVVPDVARAALDLLGEESALFLFNQVKVDPAPSERTDIWLLGTPTRLVAFSIAGGPKAWWKADHKVSVELVRGMVSSEAVVSGGVWLAPGPSARTLRIASPLLARGEAYFSPLLAWSPVKK